MIVSAMNSMLVMSLKKELTACTFFASIFNPGADAIRFTTELPVNWANVVVQFS